MKIYKYKIDINSLESSYDPRSMIIHSDFLQRKIITKIIVERNKHGRLFTKMIVGLDIFIYLDAIPSFSTSIWNTTNTNLSTNGLEHIGNLMTLIVYRLRNGFVKDDEILFFNDVKDLQKLYRDKKLKRILK